MGCALSLQEAPCTLCSYPIKSYFCTCPFHWGLCNQNGETQMSTEVPCPLRSKWNSFQPVASLVGACLPSPKLLKDRAGVWSCSPGILWLRSPAQTASCGGTGASPLTRVTSQTWNTAPSSPDILQNVRHIRHISLHIEQTFLSFGTTEVYCYCYFCCHCFIFPCGLALFSV